jgi:predicted metal-binding protein
MKCRFGCPEYGRNAACPPNTLEVQESREFFSEYGEAVIFHFSQKLEDPETRHAWTKGINKRLVNLEREVFITGYRKAFMLYMDSCYLCEECAADRLECNHPRLSRPAPEAMAVDVFETVRRYGYPIEVLSDYSEEMNRYAILLVD